MRRRRKQQCQVGAIYASWGVLAAAAAFFLAKGELDAALVWVLLAPVTLWAYVRAFPSLSRVFGYGPVDDRRPRKMSQTPVRVVLYTALGCPFCPIVKGRLLRLKDAMGFQLQVVDVTLRPELVLSKKLRAVPVVEVEGERLVGNATSEMLAALIGIAGTVRAGFHGRMRQAAHTE